MKSNVHRPGSSTLLLAVSGGALCLCACAGGGGGGGDGNGGDGNGNGGDGNDSGPTTGGDGNDGGPTTGGDGNDGGATTGGDGNDSGATTGGDSSATPTFTIDGFTSGGQGCPDAGQVEVAFDEAAGALVLDYSSMNVSRSPEHAIQHIHCAVGLRVAAAPGWQFAAAGIEPEGTVSLPPGAGATSVTSVYFAGMPDERSATSEHTGPTSGHYAPTETIPPRLRVWSPCGQSPIFTVNASLTLRLRQGAQGRAGIGLTRVAIPIVWRGC